MRTRWHRQFGLVALGLLASTLEASGLITREEALAANYPGAVIEAERVFLTEEQVRTAATLSGVTSPPALVARYIARLDGEVIGRAYVDTHIVRTKRESLLISLGPNGRVKRIDATAFLEPREYRLPAAARG